jgi:hypothetical protein
MPGTGDRIVDKGAPPGAARLEEWLGATAFRHWRTMADRTEAAHPGVFRPDWIYGGQKHGWSLRYKKSKSFCTLIPEYRRLVVQIVFGKDEQAKAEAVLTGLGPALKDAYRDAPTFQDGKWLAVPVRSAADLDDIATLLTVKRKPKPQAAPSVP